MTSQKERIFVFQPSIFKGKPLVSEKVVLVSICCGGLEGFGVPSQGDRFTVHSEYWLLNQWHPDSLLQTTPSPTTMRHAESIRSWIIGRFSHLFSKSKSLWLISSTIFSNIFNFQPLKRFLQLYPSSWFQHVATHLKNMLVNLDHLPQKIRGKKMAKVANLVSRFHPPPFFLAEETSLEPIGTWIFVEENQPTPQRIHRSRGHSLPPGSRVDPWGFKV